MNIKLLNVLILLSVLVFGCDKQNEALQPDNVKSEASIPIQITKENVIAKDGLQLPNFASLVKQVGNSVVNITAETTFQTNTDLDPFFDLFRQFGQQIPRPKPQTQIRTSMGSGFIISKEGYILTNSHVVDGAKKITVKTMDKREFQAKLIGQDAKTDIAVLKVEVKGLSVAKIGDPGKLEVGEWVAAIGAPFGFDNTVTQGIVSAKGRNLAGDVIVPFIQTDVPINPGNSGGPLFNLNGEVVGINSQIYSRSGGYMGISFSIPIDIAISTANQLKQHGKVSHGILGVQVQVVTQQLGQSFGLKSPVGALVAQVMPDSAASRAGIKTGDIILKIDGKDIPDSTSLPLMVASRYPGQVVTLTIFRNKQTIDIKAKLGGEEKKTTNSGKEGKDDGQRTNVVKLDKFGLTIGNLDDDTKKQLNITNGVKIVDVGGVAQMAGLQEDDVILSVENKEAISIDQVKKILQSRSMAAFLILRNGQRMYVTISVN